MHNKGMWEMEECLGNGEYERNICEGKEWTGENGCGAKIKGKCGFHLKNKVARWETMWMIHG